MGDQKENSVVVHQRKAPDRNLVSVRGVCMHVRVCGCLGEHILSFVSHKGREIHIHEHLGMTDTPDEAAAEAVDATKCYSEISSTTVDSMHESNTDVSNSDVNHSESDRGSEIVDAAKSV